MPLTGLVALPIASGEQTRMGCSAHPLRHPSVRRPASPPPTPPPLPRRPASAIIRPDVSLQSPAEDAARGRLSVGPVGERAGAGRGGGPRPPAWAALSLVLLLGAWWVPWRGGLPPAPARAREAPPLQEPSASPTPPATPLPPLERIQASCRGYDPLFLTALQWRTDRAGYPPDLPALVAFDFGLGGLPEQITLATQDQLGTVYGLAYDRERAVAYAAAYHKRGAAFGPGGPGGVYAVDVAAGRTRLLAQLPAGPDRHDFRQDADAAAMDWVSRSSLADLTLDDSGQQLFVSNLTDGRIYRLSTADGKVLGSFLNGGALTDWRRNARLFALAWQEGWLYHGVVDMRESFNVPGELKAYVFRSRADGAELGQVASFSLNYGRRPYGWASWANATNFISSSRWQEGYTVGQPGALLAGLMPRADGSFLLGLRDRTVDLAPSLYRVPGRDVGAGDLLGIVPGSPDWLLSGGSDPYEDLPFGAVDEAMFGAFAPMPGNIEQTVSTSRSALLREDVGALRSFDRSGGLAHAVQLRRLGTFDAADEGPNGLGDLVALCPPEGAPEVSVPTATAVVATATAGAAATQTAVALMPTSVAQPTPLDFDRVIADACPSRNPYAATVCFPQWAYLGQNTATIVGFRDTVANAPQYGLAYADQVGSVWGLAYGGRQHTLYAAAFLKRMVPFGPGGPGAVYAIDIPSGQVRTFARVPDAGGDPHNLQLGTDDGRVALFVGLMSLGDLDLSEDESELYVFNLKDQQIYRYATADGQALGVIPMGAHDQPWAADARPFALKFYRGRLYQGLVHSAYTGQKRDDLVAYVYSSLPDGADLRLEAAVPLGYPRGKATLPGTVQFPVPQDVPLDWLPWIRGYQTLMPGRLQMAVYPQPWLVDLEVDDAGNLVLGLHDRMADMSSANQFISNQVEKPALGLGDVIRIPVLPGGGWDGAAAQPDHFQRPQGSQADRGHVGGLARLRFHDDLLANFLRLLPVGAVPLPGQASASNVLESMLWYDAAGNLLAQEDVCVQPLLHPQRPFIPPPPPLGDAAQRFRSARPQAPQHSEWVPGKGMGDVEVLCGPTSTPPPTPLISPTPSVTPTRTPSPTRTRTPSATPTRTRTPTATPSPLPTRDSRVIYLPLLVGERCDPGRQRIDVLLVMDASTSMRFATRAGRPKIAAAQEAARRFLGRLGLPEDQAGLVAFNASATVLSRLSGDRAALLAAVDSIQLAEFTRIHLGMDLARELVLAGEHKGANLPAIVLLTDGRSNPDPSQMALDAAARAKAAGIRVFTVGLGQDVEQDVLRAMASRPEDFFYAPDGEDLGAIYDAIAVAIPCPIRGWWPEVAGDPGR